MPHGPGKYDKELTKVRALCGAKGAVLIVHEGRAGNGFAVQLPADALIALPHALRDIANTIEADLRSKGWWQDV